VAGVGVKVGLLAAGVLELTNALGRPRQAANLAPPENPEAVVAAAACPQPVGKSESVRRLA
jgi:hypothetical protein